MARDKLTEYSATASENTVCGDVNIAENSALPSDLNNYAREIMTHLKNFSDGTDAITGLTVDGNIKLDGNYPTGSQNVAMGDTALDDGSLSGNANTAIGHAAMTANTSGSNNVGVGKNALLANTTGADNVAVGKNNMDANSTGSNNTALGSGALTSNTTASNNTAAGYNALAANTTGTNLVAVGKNALTANTTANNNVAVGLNAMEANTSGADNTSVGTGALASNTTASNNTALGRSALNANTTGTQNVAVGQNAADAVTTGSSNVAVGAHALGQTTTSSNNTAVGKDALTANTTATSMVAVGERAGNSVTTNSNSTFVGQIAGRDTTGGDNTFIGQQAGYSVTSGTKNTIIGRYNGNQGGLDIRTSSNNIVLSDGDGNPRQVIDSSGNVALQNGVYIGTTSSSHAITVQGGAGNPGGSIRFAGGNGDNNLIFNTDSTERARLNSSGHFLVGTTSYDLDNAGIQLGGGTDPNTLGRLYVTRSNGDPCFINRKGNDGGLISLRQDGVEEGVISVSGSTVSYNGGHLSRWSQLADGTEDLTIVKGTVMTNLDQMAVWSHDEVLWTADDDLPDGVSVGDVKTAAFTEDNEQLNCMAVSSVEGDVNVAGVFVNWDHDDDDFNDMNVAMTGDMVIRIAQGTTVARGDLLMSAGDGTAKPQGDDIVRSKTIAKVTSTNVSHTYDDGSYLVPCVLMAC